MVKSILLILVYVVIVILLLQVAIQLIPPTCPINLGWCESERWNGRLWVSTNSDEGFYVWRLLDGRFDITLQFSY